MPHRNTPPPVGAPVTVPPRAPRARPSWRTTCDEVLSPVYQHREQAFSRPGDFVVGLDVGLVHGEVLDNVLLLVDLLLRIHEVVLFLLLVPLFPLPTSPIFLELHLHLLRTSLASSSDTANPQP